MKTGTGKREREKKGKNAAEGSEILLKKGGDHGWAPGW
jgi:hypothetical protein